MPFVKLDCRILDSSLWIDRDAREVFITALLMASPAGFDQPIKTVCISDNQPGEWEVPPGEYGLVEASAGALFRRALIEPDKGISALTRLCNAEHDSRSTDFNGRRMARIDGGFLILNFMKYREKDHTAAERQRRYRERKRDAERIQGNGVTSRKVTDADADADAEDNKGTRVPYHAIVDQYHLLLPMLPKVRVLSSKRQAAIRSRWKTFKVEIKGKQVAFDNLEAWQKYFKFIAEKCPFLLGNNDRNWTADFDFVIRESAMVNTLESKYVERKK